MPYWHFTCLFVKEVAIQAQTMKPILRIRIIEFFQNFQLAQTRFMPVLKLIY